MPPKECNPQSNHFTHQECKTVYIGVGSNLGDRETNCLDAVERIDSIEEIAIVKVSNWYEVEALTLEPNETQPDFINGAIEVETTLSPHELLNRLQTIEIELGRPKDHERWSPRVIDLDILLYNDLTGNDEVLTLPHPELSKRLFVLKPLCDIAADVIDPLTNKTIKELLCND